MFYVDDFAKGDPPSLITARQEAEGGNGERRSRELISNVGCRTSEAGRESGAFRYQLSVNGKRKQGAGQMSEVGGQMSDYGFWMPSFSGNRKLGILDCPNVVPKRDKT
jgi:hypothetical protein